MITDVIKELKKIVASDRPWGLLDELKALIKKLETEYQPKQRTVVQNNALHKGFELIAKALNDAGLDMRVVLKPEVGIEWTTTTVKEYLYKPIMRLKVGKESTAELAKIGEIDEVWDTLMRFLGEKHHLEYIEFPHDDRVVRTKDGTT